MELLWNTFFIVYIYIDKIPENKKWMSGWHKGLFENFLCEGVLKERELISYAAEIDIVLKWKIEGFQRIVNWSDE